MPRGPKKSANPHNNRHENGVVAPGKRVVKQRSNGHLNGSPDGRAGASPVAPPTPSPSVPKTTVNAIPSPVAIASARPNGVLSPGPSPNGARKESRGYTNEAVEDYGLATPDATADGDAADGFAPRPGTHLARAYTLPLPLTVLLSCPLRDTLAMLILLLSIPPVLVNATNGIFAVMTFVPPSGSFTTLPTLSDITSSWSPSSPSFVVTCLIDVLAMSVWIWIPFPALQAFFLDAAQAMVATTLGGGQSQRPGGRDNTLASVSMVVAMHLARYRSFLLKPIQHRLGKWAPLIGEFDASYLHNFSVGHDRSWWGTFKVFLALHIFCQGMTGMVRRRLNAPRPSLTPAATRNNEPEAASASGADMARGSSATGEPRSKPSLQNLRESTRDKISSGKRRRKQANYVRAQQPFWAAVAGAKTRVMREYETKRANADAVGAHATTPDHLGSAPFAASEQTVWITVIKETGFFFETGFLMTPWTAPGDATDAQQTEGVDRSKPLYVQCNKTNWVSMRMLAVPGSGDDVRQRWVGEVYGLSAGKTYQITILDSASDEPVLAQTIATPVPSLDASTIATSSSAALSPRPSSPASPTATLKSSIASYEARLAELEAKQRRMRKDQKAHLATLHRDIESFNERLDRHSTNDDSQASRLTHLSSHKRQLDDSIECINTELDDLDVIPDAALATYSTRRASLDRARTTQAAAHTALSEQRKVHKAALDARREQELQGQHRAERLHARLKVVAARHAKLSEAPSRNNSDPGATGPRATDRVAIEARYAIDIDALSREFQGKTARHNQLAAQVQALRLAMEQAQQGPSPMGRGGSHLGNVPSPLDPPHSASNGFPSYHEHAHSHAHAHAHAHSRSGTPEHGGGEVSGMLPGGIGTGFAPSSATGWYASDSHTGLNGNGNGSASASFGIPHLNGARFASTSTRPRQISTPDDPATAAFFNPDAEDDDDLIPNKVRRRSAFRHGHGPGGGSGSGSAGGSGMGGGSFGDFGGFGSMRGGAVDGDGEGDGGLGEEREMGLAEEEEEEEEEAEGGSEGSGEGSREESGESGESGSGSGSGTGSGSASASGTASPSPGAGRGLGAE